MHSLPTSVRQGFAAPPAPLPTLSAFWNKVKPGMRKSKETRFCAALCTLLHRIRSTSWFVFVNTLGNGMFRRARLLSQFRHGLRRGGAGRWSGRNGQKARHLTVAERSPDLVRGDIIPSRSTPVVRLQGQGLWLLRRKSRLFKEIAIDSFGDWNARQAAFGELRDVAFL